MCHFSFTLLSSGAHISLIHSIHNYYSIGPIEMGHISLFNRPIEIVHTSMTTIFSFFYFIIYGPLSSTTQFQLLFLFLFYLYFYHFFFVSLSYFINCALKLMPFKSL